MKFALLIQAHRDVAQVNRLIAGAAAPDVSVFVHWDRKSREDLSALDRRAALIESRVAVKWGDFSQVQAALNSFREILGRGKFDHLIFVSGQDYPVLPAAKIAGFLKANPGKEFMRHVPLADWKGAMGRVDYFHGGAAYAVLRAGMRALGVKRKIPGGLKPYGGSQWFTLTGGAAASLVEYADAHPEYVSFMKTVSCVDEIFFHTILLNSKFAGSVVNENFRYIDWSECAKGLTSNPNWLAEADFEKIAASPAMYCRKVEPGRSSRLMDLLDDHRKKIGI
jgi:hypothetical protein